MSAMPALLDKPSAAVPLETPEIDYSRLKKLLDEIFAVQDEVIAEVKRLSSLEDPPAPPHVFAEQELFREKKW